MGRYTGGVPRGHDDTGAGEWSEVRTFAVDVNNAPPTEPTPLVPFGVTEPQDIAFVWAASADPSNEEFFYELEIYGDEELTQLVESVSPINGALTEHELDALDEGNRYWWRIRAVDAREAASPWSGGLAFVVRSSNQAPGAPDVVAPVDTRESGDVVALVVDNGSDPDDDPVFVQFAWTNAEDFDDSVEPLRLKADPSGRTRARVAVDESGTIRWRARMTDGADVSEWAEATFEVRTSNAAPLAPGLVAPAAEELVESLHRHSCSTLPWMPRETLSSIRLSCSAMRLWSRSPLASTAFPTTAARSSKRLQR